MTKGQIRDNIKLQRNMLSTQEQLSFSVSIRENLLQTQAYLNCSHLFAFVSFQSEVDTREIIRLAFLEHKRVYVPRVTKNSMEFYEIHNLESLIPSKFGVLEPLADESKRYVEVYHNDTKEIHNSHQGLNREQKQNNKLMLLPGLAFDRTGNRIGYGAGYYDRYLATYNKVPFVKIALAYDFQVFEHIVAEEYDIKTNYILTPTQWIQCC